MSELLVDDLRFELRRSPRRHTMQITVDRGGELILTAPAQCPANAMLSFVREKRFWIFTKLAEKEAFAASVRRKRFVNGEGFPYLGRSYRLLLVDEQDVPLKLEQGRFKMRRVDADGGREHLVRWYSEHAPAWLAGRVERFRRRLGVEVSGIAIQDLGFRWGSCGKTGILNFHWRTILLPPGLVEYVIAHEVVHLLHQHHGRAFWVTLERVMPDYESRRVRLRQLGPSLVW